VLILQLVLAGAGAAAIQTELFPRPSYHACGLCEQERQDFLVHLFAILFCLADWLSEAARRTFALGSPPFLVYGLNLSFSGFVLLDRGTVFGLLVNVV